MAKSRPIILFGVALVVALVALSWPYIEQQLKASGFKCPYPFSELLTHKSVESETATKELPKYTLDQLRMYDGSDETKPILLAVAGKVLDVTSGAKFYGKGMTYNQFAGTACTRALTLGSLKEADISDDISDFDEKKLESLEETKEFYYEKYPIVGELV